MRKLYFLLTVLITPLMLNAQYKSEYDIKENSLNKSSGASSIMAEKMLSGIMLEATMLDGGYYTLGTSSGLIESILDDNCDITYGHPYAKTSYPVYYIDALPYKLEELFEINQIQSPVIKDDTLSISASNATVKVMFDIIIQEEDKQVKFVISTTNLDTIDHNMGIGLQLDPALGKWGDGYAKINNEYVDKESVYVPESIKQFELWERRSGAKGIGVNFNFPESKNDNLALLNWEFAKVYNPYSLAQFELISLYDLTIVYSSDSILTPGETHQRVITAELIEPDFSTPLFTRWDMTQFLTIDNGLIFPTKLNATLEIYNTTGSDQIVNNIGSETPQYITFTSQSQEVAVPANSYAYINVSARTNIVYENMVADLALWLDGDTGTLDIINRSVFIPQTPVSDEGLTIVDDSLATFNHPNIDLIFSVDNDETGVRIRNLSEENIFLYENDRRVTEYELEKYTGGGSNLVDVVFVLDVSGSMGNEIAAVRDNLNEFGQSLSENGFDYRIGVVTFSTTVDNVWDLTDNLEQIKTNLAGINLWGGVEDSPSALYRASELSFRAGSKRTIIWVTDEPYPEDNYSKEEVVNRMLDMGITVHGVGTTELQTNWFNPILIPTGGNFYNIYGNFRDILLDVSNVESQDVYKLSYESYNDLGEYTVELQIRYAGLGGNKTYNYMLTPPGESAKRLSFFPNPFNPTITFNVDLQNYRSGTISIYNILGQLVKEYRIDNRSGNAVKWNAVNDFGQLVSTGFYLVQLSLLDGSNNRYTETAKILYLK